MSKSIYLRIIVTLCVSLLLLLATAGGQGVTPARDACDDCIHQCKLDKDACIARGVSASECEAKYNNCVAACPCSPHK